MVRVTLEVDAPTASRLLAGLVERRVLVRTSEARRGPTVTYGSGIAFPNRQARTSDHRSRPKSTGT
jgi:ATP-dependent DNA helicase RecG